ncbi:hypothetical protein FOA52_002334 [Chlamydomonas sp. UWO 241]|nr:hypothetical protein FOA52_002334 [Chlamydomonas sp. UWO 241]
MGATDESPASSAQHADVQMESTPVKAPVTPVKAPPTEVVLAAVQERKGAAVNGGRVGEYQVEDPAAVHEAWWKAYLANTLTGWSLNAASTCFCAKCSRGFSSSVSLLQHFRDAYRHMATVEALEAAHALYAYEVAYMMTFGTSFSSYYNDQMFANGQWDAFKAPLTGGHALGHGAASPTHPADAPSDIFTASSDVSEEHAACAPALDYDEPAPGAAGAGRRAGGNGNGSARGGNGSVRGGAGGGRRGERGAAGGRGSGKTTGAGAPRAPPPPPPPPPPALQDAASFPTLGGAGGDGPSAPAAAARPKWGSAGTASTRPLRIDAATWGPGVDATLYSSERLRALARAEAEAVVAAATAAVAAEAAAEAAAANGGDAPASEAAAPAKRGHGARGQHGAQTSAKGGGTKHAAAAAAPAAVAAAAVAVAAPASPSPSAMSWRTVVSRPVAAPPAATVV